LNNDENQEKEIQYDEFGNVISDGNEDEIPDNEKIKSNLKNSSKIYYAITHTV